jgi:signal transduction histidine kinase
MNSAPLQRAYSLHSEFWRIAASRGLGLAIVRNCVEACKGTVRCRNRVPSGLEVEIRLQAQPLS